MSDQTKRDRGNEIMPKDNFRKGCSEIAAILGRTGVENLATEAELCREDGSLDPLDGRSKRHVLKTWPEYFGAVNAEVKTFEARKDDRDYRVGDELELLEYEPKSHQFTGRKVVRRVTYILRGPAFGVEAGWCIMALASPIGGDDRFSPAQPSATEGSLEDE